MLLMRLDVLCARQHTMYHKGGWEQISTLWRDIGYKFFAEFCVEEATSYKPNTPFKSTEPSVSGPISPQVVSSWSLGAGVISGYSAPSLKSHLLHRSFPWSLGAAVISGSSASCLKSHLLHRWLLWSRSSCDFRFSPRLASATCGIVFILYTIFSNNKKFVICSSASCLKSHLLHRWLLWSRSSCDFRFFCLLSEITSAPQVAPVV